MLSLLIAVFIILLIIGFPIGLSIGISTILPGLIQDTFAGSPVYIIRAMVGGIDSTPILAIPLFMLAGAIMARGGISKKIFDVFAYIVGKRTAGIPIAVVITCAFYGAISGSGPATTAAVGAMTIPILTSLGYKKDFSAALVASAGGIGVIIPPSIPFILYGMMTGTSVGALFLAGFVPGIMIAVMLMLYVYMYCRRNGEDKEKVAENYERLKAIGIAKILKDSIWALITPVIILGGIYSGIVTPTEAAVVSVFYSLIVCIFIYKTINMKNIGDILLSSAKSIAPLGLLLITAMTFARVMTLMHAPQALSEFLSTAFNNPYVFLIIVNIVFLIIGMFTDVAGAIAITAPMMVPVVAAFGINPVHFGVVLVVNLSIGLISPPIGINLFVGSSMINEQPAVVAKKILPFVGVYIVFLMLITYIPQISLVLNGIL